MFRFLRAERRRQSNQWTVRFSSLGYVYRSLTFFFSLAKPPPNLTFAQQPMASVLKASIPQQPPRPAPVVLPPIRYAAAAAAAVTPHLSSQTSMHTSASALTPATPHPPPPLPSTASSIPPSSSLSPSTSLDQPPSPSLTHPSITSPMLSSAASVSQQPDGSFYSGQDSPSLSEAIAASTRKPAATSSPQRASVARQGKAKVYSKVRN